MKIFLLFAVVFFLSACSSSQVEQGTIQNNISSEVVEFIEMNDMFYHERSFYSAIASAKDTKEEKNIQAIIVPHHLVASDFIADLMKAASGRDIRQVIIIGPNHENVGGQAIASAKVNWQTNSGTLFSNRQSVDDFRSDLSLSEDKSVFSLEHSIGAHASFVKYYFPNAEVLPIAISSYANYDNVEKLSQWLVDNYEQKTLIVFSIDFSHYLEKLAADEKDAFTKQLILDRDISKIMELDNNDYVDSPATLATALMYASKKQLKTNIIHQGNSFDFMNMKPVETTSYFGISFSK